MSLTASSSGSTTYPELPRDKLLSDIKQRKLTALLRSATCFWPKRSSYAKRLCGEDWRTASVKWMTYAG